MHSIPVDMVRFEVVDGEIVPHYFTAADTPWLRDLLEAFDALVGATRSDVEERLRRPPGRELFGIARHLLWQMYRPQVRAAVAPRSARAALFVAAAGATTEPARAAALRRAATELETDPLDLQAALLADLPAQRRLVAPVETIGAEALALRGNTAIAQALLRRATNISVELTGNTRAILRQARLCGLICTLHRRVAATADREPACTLAISGPLSLLTRTTAYGRALAALLPALAWCRGFRLIAHCAIQGDRDRTSRLVLTHLSPVYPSAQPRRYDSALEARFAADLLRATRTWILTREPEPIALGDKLIFPDFELRHVGDPRRRWLVEIVGFWTPAYLTAKLADLRRARLDHLILCVDAARACDASSFPQHAHLVWFKRRIEVREVLAVVDGAGGADVARDA